MRPQVHELNFQNLGNAVFRENLGMWWNFNAVLHLLTFGLTLLHQINIGYDRLWGYSSRSGSLNSLSTFNDIFT